MKLVFVTSGQYPEGGASVNRILAYAKGLSELGHEIKFILLKKQEWERKVLIKNGIQFTCVSSPSISKTDSKIKKIKAFFKTINNTQKEIALENNTSKITALVLLGDDILVLFPLLRLAKKLNLRVFHERTEYPFVVGGKTMIGKINLSIYLKFILKKFDGIYVITHALKNYFLAKTNGKVPVIIINMIVDPSRFVCGPKLSKSDPVISYCGTLDGEKDGVSILIESFAMITDEFPNVKLQLIGSLENVQTREKIESLVKGFNLNEKVILTGAVKRDIIPGLLCNSDILALSRPDNKQAEGGFPTKLGEYLATGNAVVITDVGEISRFLTDKKNAYISEPDSAQKFSQKLREALLDKNRIQIGLEGKKLVFNEFNYLNQAQALEKMFLEG